MRQIEDKLSLFVKEQFPSFYNEEGEMFQIFLRAYYEFLEQENQTLDFSRNLLEYLDVDKTTADFLEHFKRTYLAQLPGLLKTDDRLTIKNIMDFYRAKGTPRAVQLLFRLIFDEDITISYPSEDVLKPSTSDFKLPRYVEVYAPDLDKLTSLKGIEIVGSESGAKAFVESIGTRLLNRVKVHVMNLSNLRGNFLRGEIVAKSSDGLTEGMPVITGSLSDINITLGGSDNKVGDIFDIVADSGKLGQARVTAIDDATGLVDFQLANGGFGFSKDANVTFTDVNDQNLQVNNLISTAQSVSNVHIILGANARPLFAVGDSITVDTSDANGVISAIGNDTNAAGDAPNTHIIVNNMFGLITTNDKIANSTNGNTTISQVRLDDNLWSLRVANAEFLNFETVEQEVESVNVISATTFNNDILKYLTPNTDSAHWTDTASNADTNPQKSPTVQGLTSGGSVVANGYIINTNIGTGTNKITVALVSGSFANQITLPITLASAGHGFELNEKIDEENEITLEVTGVTGSFGTNGAGVIVKGDNSGANGLLLTSNSSKMTLSGSFGTFTSNDNVVVVSSSANSSTANVTGINITNSGANGQVSTVSASSLNLSDVVGEFNNGKKVKGRRSNALATISSVATQTGAASVRLLGNNDSSATISTTANLSVTAIVIGSNTDNVGFKTTRFSNGIVGAFHNNASAIIRGHTTNTVANVVAVGTGTGADFSIGTLENEDSITIYTDFVGENNVSNVAYLDCVIDGGNSGIGFLQDVTINSGGTGYDVNQIITFSAGGAGGGLPTSNATAKVTAVDGSNAIIGIQVTDQGSGFFSNSAPTLPSNGGGTEADLEGVFNFGYGFPKSKDGDFNNVLDTVLSKLSGNVGTISSLSSINPGNNYNFDPFVSVYTPSIAKFDRRDLVLNLSAMANNAGIVRDFVIGETINQTVSVTSQVLTVNSSSTPTGGFTITGGTLDGTQANNKVINDLAGTSVIQTQQTGSGGNGNTTITTLGTISSGNSTTVVLKDLRVKTDVNGTVSFSTSCTTPFSTTVDSGAITFAEPGAQINTITGIAATIRTLGTVDESAIAKGQVYKFNNNQDGTGDVGIRRLSFSVGFNDSGTISGAASGAGGTIDSIYEDLATRPIGDNAVINADARAANGIVTDVEVINSGIGYQHNANVTLQSTNTSQQIVVSGLANVTTTGLGEGYWASKESFLNNKFIHDNDFYQSHSYVIESALSLNKYRDILLDSTHIAGTRLFGRLFKESIANVAITVSNNEIQTINSNSGAILSTVQT